MATQTTGWDQPFHPDSLSGAAGEAFQNASAKFTWDNLSLANIDLESTNRHMLNSLFDHIDTSGDGLLQENELKQFYEDNINYFLDMAFDQADKDHDGTISRAEFKEFVKDMHRRQEEKKRLTQPWREISKFTDPWTSSQSVDPIWAAKKIQASVESMDTNEDSVVTREEFIEFWRKIGVKTLPRNYASHPWAHAGDHLAVGVQASIRDALLRMAWKNADADGDGQTSKDEACRVLGMMGIRSACDKMPPRVDFQTFRQMSVGYTDQQFRAVV